jgi:hypothetical protein
MNSQSEDTYKNETALNALEAKSEQLLKDIESELDENKCIQLVREYNNLQGRLDVANRLVNPDKKIKPIHVSIQKTQRRPTKRCG